MSRIAKRGQLRKLSKYSSGNLIYDVCTVLLSLYFFLFLILPFIHFLPPCRAPSSPSLPPSSWLNVGRCVSNMASRRRLLLPLVHEVDGRHVPPATLGVVSSASCRDFHGINAFLLASRRPASVFHERILWFPWIRDGEVMLTCVGLGTPFVSTLAVGG
jgi:hypothetical protein